MVIIFNVLIFHVNPFAALLNVKIKDVIKKYFLKINIFKAIKLNV
jgi:hypothetical protein